jgi:hypothetical protein
METDHFSCRIGGNVAEWILSIETQQMEIAAAAGDVDG